MSEVPVASDMPVSENLSSLDPSLLTGFFLVGNPAENPDFRS
jgi:hypothetical protein